ncbi:PilZ domain-containing protein [Methylobacterium oryzihabitans]|nr:PilZ domain-containing protein [Methylobacterium oryzihabitans]
MTTLPRPVRIQALLTSRAKLDRTAAPAILCFLHNLSDDGACVSFPDGAAPPERFDLFLEQGGQAHPVEIRWRDSDRVGVRFLDPLSDETLCRLLPHLGLAAGEGGAGDAPGF